MRRLGYYADKTLPPSVCDSLRRFKEIHLRNKKPQQIFEGYYRSNYWRGQSSVSGTGSDPPQTKIVRQEIASLMEKIRVRSTLDIPCGDFQWMKEIDLRGIQYTGADIVPKLVENNKKYERENVRFTRLDVTRDSLPQADLVVVRDCFVHFSYEHIRSAVIRICESKSLYLLTTTFPARTRNRDIYTGSWRPLNLQLPPFSFPEPDEIINEGCAERGGLYSDKSLALWRLSAICNFVRFGCSASEMPGRTRPQRRP